jgi:hypothetical protein
MPWMMAAAVIGSSLIGGSSAKSAANTQAAAADRAAELQREQFERQVELQEPWRQAGITALNKLTPLATEYTPFGMSQFQQDPGYAFRMSEGMKGLERSAAARGGLLSGATMKGIQRYGQDLASQEYQNAFNRYQAERQARMGPLQSLAGVGQTATNALGTAGQNYATGAGEAIGAAGQARASGYMGMANAITGGVGSYMNYNQQQTQNSLLQQALNRNTGYGGNTMGPQYGQQPLDSSFDQYLAR